MFARDLMCSQPEMIADIISRILRSSPSGGGMDISNIEYNNILLMVKSCGRHFSRWFRSIFDYLVTDTFSSTYRRQI
jgi:hypothetical protein